MLCDWLFFDAKVHTVPVVLRSVFVREQLQVDGLRSSFHAPVLEKDTTVTAKKQTQTQKKIVENIFKKSSLLNNILYIIH